ncbi:MULTISPECIES: hypothetical protein [Flavobacterium]|uniref:Uncharacterized protein n=1 Tax=Flavobacterium endoglycinae TaxID=2816357 RepID=A0ABX7Q9V6_9FLAO|nr:hypothetical protein [Flavobacterium endoglycinae]QSW87732.1 hypothetical protein J0383_15770 [Flavobacterium endoglycinae]
MSEEIFPGPIKVPLSIAKEWEKRYDESVSTIETARGVQKVKGFLIPRETLENVLKLETTAVRAYLGINDEGEKNLFFVGAEKDDAGKYIDVYGVGASNGISARAGEEAEEVVYDGTRPSPPY